MTTTIARPFTERMKLANGPLKNLTILSGCGAGSPCVLLATRRFVGRQGAGTSEQQSQLSTQQQAQKFLERRPSNRLWYIVTAVQKSDITST